MDFARVQPGDFGYSLGPDYAYTHYGVHREGEAAMHLPSPNHRHSYGMEIPSSIQQLRRSLSRSPSKPSRFRLRMSDSSGSPISPLALTRAFSPKPHNPNHSPVAPQPETPFTPQPANAPKKRAALLRRTAPFRSSPRNRAKSKSPRRVLSDSADHGNASHAIAMQPAGEENIADGPSSPDILDQISTEQRQSMRFDIDDKPIKFSKFGISRSRPDLTTPGAPAKSSPLKRSDGIMNLDVGNVGSPVAKRRSLHGASAFGADFDVFDHAPTPRTSGEEPRRSQEGESGIPFAFSSPSVTNTQSPLRKTASLRKSTISQRYGANTPRSKQTTDGEFAMPGAAASKTRQRMSLDGSLGFSASIGLSPFRRSENGEGMRQQSHQPFLRGSTGNHQPHPLSNALTPSSSTSNFSDMPAADARPAPPTVAKRNGLFSRSLPIGASRPTDHESSGMAAESSFETPMAFKMARPDPSAFMSTGLLSKKNRNVDDGTANRYVMPGTPSKRNSFPPVTVSPSATRRLVLEGKLSRPEFGQPSTPFSFHKQSTSASFGKGVSIFGSSNTKHQRRYSFASVDGDENTENPRSPCANSNSPHSPNSEGNSPCGNRMASSQSSDEMPPTPTKQNDGSGRRKDNSLRRQAFRPQRASLGADTFTAPTASDPHSTGTPKAVQTSLFGGSSPQTPNESFTPPDPSSLSISCRRRGSMHFNSSTNSNPFPPATPTTPRDLTNFFAHGPDFDASLTKRFDKVTLLGGGEFSDVYRAEKMGSRSLGFASSPATQVWAVKKSKKPYTGPSDRLKKLQEVRTLEALRGHEHVISLEDYWEYNSHLYIQTEFCEEGTLQRFLATAGHKCRLDDFRMWKILLEISSGVQFIHSNGYIHLDLKPANILITFDGVLKIADFGLATPWPAGNLIDGEGDRHYLAPEALQGRYDKPCDVFALGTIMLEIAGNIIIPENGVTWQRLRTGDFSDFPSLTWSEDSNLDRDVHGEPIDVQVYGSSSPTASLRLPEGGDDSLDNISASSVKRYSGGLAIGPSFMIQDQDPNSIIQIIHWMMSSNPDLRPTIEQVYGCYGCQWVAQRARAGATIYEGNWGPADDVLNHNVQDADMMDTS